jgi:hypothetical protein
MFYLVNFFVFFTAKFYFWRFVSFYYLFFYVKRLSTLNSTKKSLRRLSIFENNTSIPEVKSLENIAIFSESREAFSMISLFSLTHLRVMTFLKIY